MVFGKEIMHSCNQRKCDEPDPALDHVNCWHKTRVRCPWSLLLTLSWRRARRRCCSEGQNPPASMSGGIGVPAGEPYGEVVFSISTLVSYVLILL